MKRRVISALLAILAVCGCQVMDKKEFAPEGKSFSATMESVGDATNVDTKTSLDNLNVLWKQGDQVSIFAGSTINEHYQVTDASDGKTTAALTRVESPGFVAGSEIPVNVAFYPYASTAEIAKSGSAYVISGIELPATQYYASASFDNGAFPMAAVTSSTSDYSLKFKNILGCLKLQLKGTAKIASISVTGNNGEVLCGAAQVTVSNTATPTIALTDATAKTVSLDCGNGVQLSKTAATAFIIALPPMTMTGGFTVTVTDTDGAMMELKTIKSQTVKRSDILKFPVKEYIPYVDLGLSVKWAAFNVGATAPEDYGDYFTWGETEPHYESLDPLVWKTIHGHQGYEWEDYKWCDNDSDSPATSLTKYCTDSEHGLNGFVDNKTVLDLEDDAARVNLGGTWRMPTIDEWIELKKKCTWTWTTQNGVTGRLVTGPNGNSIFLPAAGWFINGSLIGQGTGGFYWSSSLYHDDPDLAYRFHFDEYGWLESTIDRAYGRPVRPVIED